MVSVAADDMLVDLDYNPAAVHRAFETGLKELTGERTLANAWASLVSPDDVVGIKINCIGAPRISSSLASINETIAGLKGAGVKENAIVVWDRMDRDFRRTGLAINRGTTGVRVMGCSTEWEGVVPWVAGYDPNVFVSFEDGTLKKFRELVGRGFTREGSHREIFNSVSWLWTLATQGNEKARNYEQELRRLYTDYDDREGIKRIAEEVAERVRRPDDRGRGPVLLRRHRDQGHHQARQHRRPQAQRGQRRHLGGQEHRAGRDDEQGPLPHRLLRQGHPRDPGQAVHQGQDGPAHRRGGQDLDRQRGRGADRPRQPHLLQPRPRGHGPDRPGHPRGEAGRPGARVDPRDRDARRGLRQEGAGDGRSGEDRPSTDGSDAKA
ncbi:MAG: hypothetical protein M0C28_41735 [Candidatus Moduliflexus flocculans]|nr:hypothetical protein [Candidatus Moduliflexus flocculans]